MDAHILVVVTHDYLLSEFKQMLVLLLQVYQIKQRPDLHQLLLYCQNVR